MKQKRKKLLSIFLIIGFLLFSHLTSFAERVQEGLTMERFDIERFNRNKSKYTWLYTLQDGTKVHEWENIGYGYQIETTSPNSAYTRIKLFNYDGNLIGENLRFDLSLKKRTPSFMIHERKQGHET